MLDDYNGKTFTSVEQDNFKNSIKKRWNYEEDFAQSLTITTEEVINYFGAEHKKEIIEAIESCNYIVLLPPKRAIPNNKKNIREYIDNNLQDENDFLSDKRISQDVSDSGSIYLSIPIIDIKNKKVEAINRIVLLPNNFDYNQSLESRGMLIRETINLVKSYFNEYFFDEEDNLIERKGLAFRTFKIDENNKAHLINERGLGIECGLSINGELKLVTENHALGDYNILEMKDERIIAGQLIKNGAENKFIENFTNIIILGDINKLIVVLNGNDKFFKLTDEIFELEQKRINSTEKNVRREIMKKQDLLFNRVGPLLTNLSISLKNDAEKKYAKQAVA